MIIIMYLIHFLQRCDPSKYMFPKITGFSLLNSAAKIQQDWAKYDNVSVINGKPVSIDTNAVTCKDIYGLSNGLKYPFIR